MEEKKKETCDKQKEQAQLSLCHHFQEIMFIQLGTEYKPFPLLLIPKKLILYLTRSKFTLN